MRWWKLHLRTGGVSPNAMPSSRFAAVIPSHLPRPIVVFAVSRCKNWPANAGADYVGAMILLRPPRITKGWTDFDAVPPLPGHDARRLALGRVLGPRGLMPSPTSAQFLPLPHLPRVIEENSCLGRVEFRVDKTSNIHGPTGKRSSPPKKLMQNFSALME